MKTHTFLLALCLSLLNATVLLGQVENPIRIPAKVKVPVDWGQIFDHAKINDICLRLAQAYPDLVRTETISDSYNGRRMVALVISDFSDGDPDRKPAYYLDGNIVGNGQQAAEITLYTAWYLAESFAENPFTRELLLRKTFYILPTINPDGRDAFLYGSQKMLAPRSGMVPVDDDGDGLYEEDQPKDLNGDGFITFMRRKSLSGRYLVDPQNTWWMIPAKKDQAGEYELLGFEGQDNDGDGKINEDPNGFYDAGYDWAWNWQPDYVQKGAYKYPFSVPENRSVKEFIQRHPNIASAQNFSYKPSSSSNITPTPSNWLPEKDFEVYKLLAQDADSIMPGWGLGLGFQPPNTSASNEMAWFLGARGVFSISNALDFPYLEFHRRKTGGVLATLETFLEEHMLRFSDAFVEWIPFDHPNYGPIEIGGFRKNYVPAQAYFTEAEALRQVAITLYLAYQMPQLSIQDLQTRKLKDGNTEITVTVANQRLLPTHAAHDLKHKIERPDYIILRDSTVLSGAVQSKVASSGWKNQKYMPHKLEVPNMPGHSSVKVRWVVKAAEPVLEIEVDSRKGGTVLRRF